MRSLSAASFERRGCLPLAVAEGSVVVEGCASLLRGGYGEGVSIGVWQQGASAVPLDVFSTSYKLSAQQLTSYALKAVMEYWSNLPNLIPRRSVEHGRNKDVLAGKFHYILPDRADVHGICLDHINST